MPNSRQHTTARLIREYFPTSQLRVGPANITVQVNTDYRWVVQPIAIRKERRTSYADTSYRADKTGYAHDWVRLASYSHPDLTAALTVALRKGLKSAPESADTSATPERKVTQ